MVKRVRGGTKLDQGKSGGHIGQVPDIEAYRALVDEVTPSDSGHTTAELAAMWGLPVRTAFTRITQLVNAGKLVVGMCMRTNNRGRATQVNVYRIPDEKD